MSEPQDFHWKATQPDLPPPDQRRPSQRNSPKMDDEEMSYWLQLQADHGWEFVGFGQKKWANSDAPQEWWIFKRSKDYRP